jgi:cell wall-associated NlpC family hydrolase
MMTYLHQVSGTLINQFLFSQYKDGGRGPHFYDCWGLTRYARHVLFNKPLLPSYGHIAANDKRSLTKALYEVATGFNDGAAIAGSIATAWRHDIICTHVALVVTHDNQQLAILETNQSTGPRLVAIRDFESTFPLVRYYND